MTAKYAMFIQMNATKAWLTLSAQERRAYVLNDLAAIFKKYPHVSIEFYDAEAYTKRCSDIAILRTEVLSDYSTLMDELVKIRFFTEPYFEIVDIIPTTEADYLAAD